MKRITLSVLSFFLITASAAFAQNGSWHGSLDIQGTKIAIVFHLDEPATVDSPDQGVKGIPAEVKKSGTGAVTVNIPSIGASFEGIWMGKSIVGTFSQGGASLPLNLVPGVPTVNRPQTPVGPFPYTMEEVSFSNGDAVLSGTLTLPEGWNRNTPVVIMVTGSGLQNRDEEIFEHKPFAVIADALARAGTASLRYDDRGFGASTGDAVNCTTEDLKDDALAGILMLREKFGKVGVLGHSEGGTIALMLAAEGKADFAVSLAGMVVSGKETLLWQNRLALEGAGVPGDITDEYCGLLEKAFDASMEGAPLPSANGTDLPEGLKQNYMAVAAQLKSPYLRYFVSCDIRPRLGSIECPVLALGGSKDMQVEPSGNIGALRNALPANKANKIEILEGLNHLFQHCTSGALTEYKEIEETFSPQALDLITGWIKSVTSGD